MIMIVSGVLIASSEVSAIMALKDSIDTGTGQYRRSRFRNSHIIVLGGAVTSGSATLQIFLEELLHPSRPSTMLPDVVLMSEEAPCNGLRRILASPLGRQHVRFIRGSPMDQSALARADAANADMSFIMGDLSCLEHLAHAEDEAPPATDEGVEAEEVASVDVQLARAVEVLKSWTYFEDLRKMREERGGEAADGATVAAAEAAEAP